MRIFVVGRTLMVAVAAAGLLTGCGGSAETGPALDVASEFVSAVARSDGSAACALLAPEAVRRVDELRPEGCARALPALALPADPPGEVQVWSDTGQVRTAGDTLFLREFGDRWLIIGAGCSPRDERPYRCKVDGT
jgi:hypothetical protein